MGLLKKPKRDESNITRIPDEWNKDFFHMVNINYNDNSYVGYFWATSNWVEVHCFKNVSLETVYSKTEYTLYIADQLVYKLWANIGYVFKKRVISAIIPRSEVRFSYLLNSQEFYSCKEKFKDTIYIYINKSDINRWKIWHPDDKSKHVLPGSSEVGWYAICDNNLYKLEWDYYSLIGKIKHFDGSYTNDFTLVVKHKVEASTNKNAISKGYVCTNKQGYKIYCGEIEYETGMIPTFYAVDEKGKPLSLPVMWHNGEWIVRDWGPD
jgi:hypothetical protein